MDESSKTVVEQQTNSKGTQGKPAKTVKKRGKRVKGQKDIRTLIKTKNELLKYSKDFDLICKQSGIDVDPEQLQLAIALSKSLQESESSNYNNTDAEKNLTCNQRRGKIRTTLQEYGFKVPEINKNTAKRIKRHRKQYKLLLVSDTEKQQIIADKYSHLLFCHVSKINYESLPKFTNSNSHLYNLSTNISYADINDDEIYYVNDLVPKSLCQRHHMLRDWSEIPGRPVSPKFEKTDISFKNTPCSQEELDNILSGPITAAQNIVKKNYRSKVITRLEEVSNTPEPMNTHPTTSELEIVSQDSADSDLRQSITNMDSKNPNEDCKLAGFIDVETYKYHVSPATNRSCSPDLFDDEVTVLMHCSKDNILLDERNSEKTMVRENDFMDLTKCVDVMNFNKSNHKHSYLSQGTSRTRIDPNDFMDLTGCVTACSQKIRSEMKCIDNYAEKIDNTDDIVRKKSLIPLNQSSNHNSTLTFTPDNNCDKSLDDTIIMIEEDYLNAGRNVVNLIPNEAVVIDLVGDQCNSPKILTSTSKHTDFEEESPDLGNEQYLNHRSIASSVANHEVQDDTSRSEENNLSSVRICSVQSIVTHENIEVNGISCKDSRNVDYNEIENETKDSKSYELDLTQSSNSIDSSECVHDTCINNKSLHDVITLNGQDSNSNDFERDKCKVDLNHTTNSQNTSDLKIATDHFHDISDANKIQATNTRNSHRQIVLDLDSDSEYVEDLKHHETNLTPHAGKSRNSNDGDDMSKNDPLLVYVDKITKGPEKFSNPVNKSCESTEVKENVSICSQPTLIAFEQDKNLNNTGIFFDDYIFENDPDIQYHEFNGGLRNSIDGDNARDLIIDDVLEDENYIKQNNAEIAKSVRDMGNANLINVKTNLTFENDPDVENDTQNNDIDLTQSDSFEERNRSPDIIEIPPDLGKRNDISIDYDDVCIAVEASTSRNYTRAVELFDNNDCCELDRTPSKNGAVSNCSQSSEVFEISDNEFNYSINQHRQDNDSIQKEQARFDIGGMSIINEFLNRNSVSRRSKQLRCSCSSNIGPNSNNDTDENCLPVDELKNKDNFSICNENRKSKSYGGLDCVTISTPLRSNSDDNILFAQTPKHDDYVIKTDNVTPMPNYEIMSSPERNEELDKFGIKPLKRKRAIQILTHIYNQTHPVMEVMSEAEQYSSPSKIRRDNDVTSFPRRNIASQIDSIVEIESVQSTSILAPLVPSNLSQESAKTGNECQKSQILPTKGTENALYEETKLTPDIRDIVCDPEDWVFQKREKAKVHSCQVPLHIAFHNYVSCRQKLREAILRYEPIRIDNIHKGMVGLGYRYNPKDLLKFMDKKCITVKTADSSRKNENKNR